MINFKKQFLTLGLLVVSIACFAQEKSTAYNIGYALGKIVGIVLVVLLVLFIIKKVRGK